MSISISVYLSFKTFALRNWLRQLCGLARGKSEIPGQVGRLETQAGVLCCSLENSFFLQETSDFVFKPSDD